jgi:valyl-tRNA synthetase
MKFIEPLLSLEDKHYNHSDIEVKIYSMWEENGCFSGALNSNKPNFSVVIPPPNVTGRLHIGHALNNVVQDVIVRFKRMDGFNVSWVPGTDHAGISTQSVVKKQLQAEGINYRDLGREETIKKIWEWKDRFGSTILNQIRRLGCSCDWQREAFTMDEQRSEAVLQAFIELYKAGLIYRGKRIVNWCPFDQTALSNDETYTLDGGESGFFWSFAYKLIYPIEGRTSVVIATTRPETILGDTAIAVNPNDARYRDLIGAEVVVPIVNRVVKIIADEYVDPEFGTGCLKVTPAHDPNDYEIALRHNLPLIDIMNNDATLNDVVPEDYRGLNRFVAREKIVAELKASGHLVKLEERMVPLVRAERSKEIIEYRLSDQWFVKTGPLAEKALESFSRGELEFFPKRWGQVYQTWLENIKDWCISRQIWWGHRIPAWHNLKTGEIIVARDTPSEVVNNQAEWQQDPDVLDTWFSSALWPFSTFGWPKSENDLKTFYPNSVLITGKDIIALWIARMTMSGLFHLNQSPFKTVIINSTVTDEDGEMMSKSKGNGIDPLHILDGASKEELTAPIYEARPRDMDRLLKRIDKLFPNGFQGVGADALRFSLLTLNSEAQQVSLSLGRFAELGKPFNDKLWNACRFVIQQLDQELMLNEVKVSYKSEDLYVLTKLDETITNVRGLLEQFKISAAFELIYKFFWDDVCDWYLEIVKFRMKSTDRIDIYTVQLVLAELLSSVIRLLHPAVPFITEELWSHLLPRLVRLGLVDSTYKIDSYSYQFCTVSPYPKSKNREISVVEKNSFLQLKDLISQLRAKRLEVKINKNSILAVHYLKGSNTSSFFENKDYCRILSDLVNVSFLEIDQKEESFTALIVGGFELCLDLEVHRDFNQELANCDRDLKALDAKIQLLKVKLSNQDFIAKAPSQVVEKEKESLQLALEQQQRLAELSLSLQAKV